MATRRRRDSNLREYRFKIDAYTPKTIPLIRLTAYLRELALLFGNTDNVHLDRIAEGSTEPILLVEREAEIKVRERLQVVRANDGPEDAMKAHKRINELLREDNGKASVIDPIRRKILIFQGRDLNKLLEYGPFTQPGTLEGIPIKIGGEGDWVPVHLQDSLGEVHWCWAKRNLAREIAQHIFGPVIRIDGSARWTRLRNGDWDMVSFRAKGFNLLDSTQTLRESIQHLRAVPAKWKELDDPLGELKKIRHGT